MFSRKRLGYILLITMIFSGLFFLFNLDHDFLRSQSKNDADGFTPSPTISAVLSGDSDSGFLVIGSPQNDSETMIKTNVIKALSLLKVKMRVTEFITSDDLMGNDFLVFIASDISTAGDLDSIAKYIQKGGRAVFAAGIPVNADWRFLDPVWGILERGTFSTVTDLTFNQGYFPYDKVISTKGFASYSTSLRLDESCEILIKSENNIPLVWTHDYDLGRITMINGTFMESKLSLGILIASISNAKEQSIYPVLGTKTVFLDAIPPLFDSNDDNSFEYYGRSAESFVRDRLWAVLLQKAVLLDLKLTSSFMAIDKLPFESQNANQQTFSYISRQIIQNNGEITLSGNHVDLDDLSLDRIKQTKIFFEKFFPNYNIHAYYPLYGKIDQRQIELIKSVYPKLDIIRILYEGDELTQSSGDFEVTDDKLVYPTTTYGYKAEGLQLYTFLSVLTSHGTVSHSFDINSLFTVPSSESNWNTLNTTFDVLSDVYFRETSWLESLTISSAAEKVRAMAKLNYQMFTEEGKITVACSDMTVGQTFMFYTKRPLLSAQGATYKKINDTYYLIQAQAALFTLSY